MRCFAWHMDQEAVCQAAILNLANDFNPDESSMRSPHTKKPMLAKWTTDAFLCILGHLSRHVSCRHADEHVIIPLWSGGLDSVQQGKLQMQLFGFSMQIAKNL